MILIRFVIFSMLLIIYGCALKPPVAVPENNWQQQQQQLYSIDQWQVEGRIGVKTIDQGFTANLNWQHQPDNQQLRIYGSFGKTYAEINQNADFAILKISADETYQSTDIESLVHKVLGYSLPVDQLEYWIMGLPAPGNDSALTFDKLGYPETMNYQQWKVSYNNYQRFGTFGDHYLPTKITLTDGEVTLKLSLRNWSMDIAL